MSKKLLIVLVLAMAFVMAFSSAAFAEFVKGFDKNLELYPNWIGTDAQGLPSTMPIFNYSTGGYINEIVYVEVPCDTDRDGKRDRVTLYIRRPVTEPGFLCPAVMEFSPYHNGTFSYPRMADYINSENDHYQTMAETVRFKPNNDIHLEPNPDTTHLTYEDIRYKGIEAWDPLWWNSAGSFITGSWYTGTASSGIETYTDEFGKVRTRNLYTGSVPAATVPTEVGAATSYTWSPPARWSHYFVRGYAVIYGQLLGNRDCEGITNSQHVEEWLSAAAACKWLNGEAKAYTTRTGTVEVKADWANGHVALDGTSYPGTTPTLAAMAGAIGLKAIMPEAHVASWYEYYRSGGALHGPEGYGGEDMNLHSSYNFSRFNGDITGNNVLPLEIGPNFDLAAQKAYVETQFYMMSKQDRYTGDYNVEWDHRNLTRAYGKIASDVGVLQTNGQQDWNVMPRHAYQALQSFRDNFGGTHKIVSALSKHASQNGRAVMGKDGVNRGMLKWYLMFLDHFLLGLDNQVDELMYDVNIANSQTGVMEGFDYDTTVEERGTIIPGTYYQRIYLTPGPEDKAGRLSYNAPAATIEGFTDLTLAGQINAPQHPGASSKPSPVASINTSQGNYTPSTNQITYCDDRVVGVSRSSTAFGAYGSLINCVDRPVDGRLMYISEPLEENMVLSGAPVVHLNAAPTKGTGNLTVALLEIGRIPRAAVRIEAVGLSFYNTTSVQVFPAENGADAVSASTYGTTVSGGGTTGYPSLARVGVGNILGGLVSVTASNFKYVTWGHTDLQNPSYDGKAWFQVPEQNYVPNYYFQTTLLEPGKYYDYVVELNPYNYVFEKGQRIAVMVYGTDILASSNLDEESTSGLDVMLGEGTFIDIPLRLVEPSEAITIEAGNSHQAARGEIIDIPYGISGNDFGFTVLDMELPFDSAIYAPINVVPAALLDGAEFEYSIEGNALKVAIAAEENITGDGELFTVTYEVSEKAPYIFNIPLKTYVTNAKYNSFMDKLVDLKAIESDGFLATKLVELVPTAFVAKLNGNKNNLTITVTETYVDGTVETYTATFSISNNAAGIYEVGGYEVYVDTKGNDQIRACYVIDTDTAAPGNGTQGNDNNQGNNGNGNSQGNQGNGNSQGNNGNQGNGNSQGNNGNQGNGNNQGNNGNQGNGNNQGNNGNNGKGNK